MPRGVWCIASATGRPPSSSSTPTRAASPSPTTSSRRTPGPTSATRCRPSAASSPSTARSTLAMAEALAPVFTEVLIAPGYERRRPAPAAREDATCGSSRPRRPAPPGLRCAPSTAGFLVQTPDPSPSTAPAGRSSPRPRPPRRSGPTSSWRGGSSAKVTSNAIVLVKDGQAVGIGCGQQNRRDAGQLAAREGRRSGRGRRLRQRRVLPVRRRPRRRRRGRCVRGRSSRAARSATTRSSPRPTSTAWPWSSRASATSATEGGLHGGAERISRTAHTFWCTWSRRAVMACTRRALRSTHRRAERTERWTVAGDAPRATSPLDHLAFAVPDGPSLERGPTTSRPTASPTTVSCRSWASRRCRCATPTATPSSWWLPPPAEHGVGQGRNDTGREPTARSSAARSSGRPMTLLGLPSMLGDEHPAGALEP